jgi:hypothetical protein
MLKVEDIAACIQNDRHTFLVRGLASCTKARNGIFDAAHRSVKAVLQVDPNDAGLNDLGDVCRNVGRGRAISGFYICSYRHLC